jgi:hypothetical protein
MAGGTILAEKRGMKLLLTNSFVTLGLTSKSAQAHIATLTNEQ